MTYFDTLPAGRRTHARDTSKFAALLRIGAALALFALFTAALAYSDLPTVSPAPGDDWHGNVAASGYTG